MIIVTNPAANLPPDTVAHYGVVVSPQRIVVDGEFHDTREPTSLLLVDEWVSKAKKHPYLIGSTTAEFFTIFSELLAKGEKEILVILSSKKIIQSCTAATVAARNVVEANPGVRIHVIDCLVTDGGLGLGVIFAAEAIKAGLSFDKIVAATEAFVQRHHMILAIQDMSYLVKGGRASFLKAWAAELLKRRPFITFEDGEVKPAGTYTLRAEAVVKTGELLASRVRPAGRIWAAVVHGNDVGKGRLMAKEIQARFKVDFLTLRPFSSSVYLHVGPGTVGAFIYPTDGLPWTPPVPSLPAPE